MTLPKDCHDCRSASPCEFHHPDTGYRLDVHDPEIARLRGILLGIALRLEKAPVAESRRLTSEDYCGKLVMGFPGVPCGLPKGHAAAPSAIEVAVRGIVHKRAVDLLVCVAIDLADAIDAARESAKLAVES